MEDSGEFIQKMMELGIGLSMVQQMPAMMNGVFAASSVPTVTPPAPTGTYVAVEGKQAGPFDDGEMQRMIQSNLIGTETLVWRQGMPQWKKASEVPEVNKWLLMKNI